jgi:outer membrane murein-binding lipoprotein Lpp
LKTRFFALALVLGTLVLAGCSGEEKPEELKGKAPEVSTDTKGALPPEQRAMGGEKGEADR